MDTTETTAPAKPILPGIPCKNVLCWVGFPDQPDDAVQAAVSLARHGCGECHVVMCLDSPFPDGRGPRQGRRSQRPLTPELISRAARKLAELYGGGIRTMVLPGHPVREVQRYARNNRADLIVMGQQALTVERNYGVRLADQAPCTVMILLPPKQAL